MPMLLGREVPDMMQLLEEEDASSPEPQGPEPEDVQAVTTRGQKRNQEREAALTRARELEDDAQPSPIDSNDDETPSGAIEPEDTPWCEFDDSLFSPERRRAKHRLSRSQRREKINAVLGVGLRAPIVLPSNRKNATSRQPSCRSCRRRT